MQATMNQAMQMAMSFSPFGGARAKSNTPKGEAASILGSLVLAAGATYALYRMATASNEVADREMRAPDSGKSRPTMRDASTQTEDSYSPRILAVTDSAERRVRFKPEVETFIIPASSSSSNDLDVELETEAQEASIEAATQGPPSVNLRRGETLLGYVGQKAIVCADFDGEGLRRYLSVMEGDKGFALPVNALPTMIEAIESKPSGEVITEQHGYDHLAVFGEGSNIHVASSRGWDNYSQITLSRDEVEPFLKLVNPMVDETPTSTFRYMDALHLYGENAYEAAKIKSGFMDGLERAILSNAARNQRTMYPSRPNG